MPSTDVVPTKNALKSCVAPIIIGIFVILFLTNTRFTPSFVYTVTQKTFHNHLRESRVFKQQHAIIVNRSGNDTTKQSTGNCDLVNTFNNIPNDLKQSMQANKFMYEAMPSFFKYFESELVCDPSIEFNPQPPLVHLDCSESRYKLVLNGTKRTDKIHIVDLVMFGFDLHYLEIRLYEYYDVIDAFFIIEQDVTLRGYRKPFLLAQVLNTSRFVRFADKIHYIQDHVEDEYIQTHLRGEKANLYDTAERAREKVKQYFLQNFKAAGVSLEKVYVLQNDGDELISRAALYHFKHCQDRNEFPVFVPSVLYKQNIDCVYQVRRTMTGLQNIPKKYREVIKHVWRLGPTIWRADLVTNDSMRMRDSNHKLYLRYHLGYGAGNHFSNPSHPLLHIIKQYSTEDARPFTFTNEFWTRLKHKNLTLEFLEYELFECDPHYRQVSAVLSKDSQKMLKNNLPWIIKQYPQRYPFLTNYNRHKRQEKWVKQKCEKKMNFRHFQ